MKIIVAMGPIFLTILEEMIPLIPPIILQTNKANPTYDIDNSNTF